MKTSSIKALITSMFLCAAILTACNENEGITRKDIHVGKLTATPATVTVAVGGIRAIRAEITPQGANQMIYWKSANPEIAEVANGIIMGISPGSTTITVNSVEDATKKAEINVTVVPAPVPVEQILFNVESPLTVYTDETVQLTWEILPENATSREVLWKNTNPGVATVSETGVVTPVSTGGTALTVCAASDVNKFATLIIMVQDRNEVVNPLVGHWLFDDPADLTKAVQGNDLVTVGAGFATVAGPNASNGAVRVSRGSHYIATHGIQPVEWAGVGEYTFMFDFKIPALGAWYSFLQTNPNNSDDAEFFINTAGRIGVGETGYSTPTVTPNVWQRVVITVKFNSEINFYLDGTLIHQTTNAGNSRFLLAETALLFGDNDGDDAEFDVAEVALWNVALSAEEVAALGQAGNPIE